MVMSKMFSSQWSPQILFLVVLMHLVFDCDGVVLEIYLDHKFQWQQEGLNCETIACEIVA